MDLFDWLDVIRKLKNIGYTQAEIGDKIGWNETKVKQYGALINGIVTDVFNLCIKYQNSRVTEKVTYETFEFSEYWFRTSGLYDLQKKYQLKLINAFVTDKFNWNKSKVQSESAKYKQWQEFIETAKEKLLDIYWTV